MLPILHHVFSKEAPFSTKTWLFLQRNVVLYPSHNQILNHYPSATSLVNLLRGVMLPANDWPLGLTSLESEGFFFLWNCWKRLPPYSWGHFCETFSKSFWLKTNIFNLNSCSCFFCRSVCRHLYHSLRWFPHQKNLKISSRRFLIGLPAGTDASIVCNDVLGHLGQVTQLQHGGFLQLGVAGCAVVVGRIMRYIVFICTHICIYIYTFVHPYSTIPITNHE